MGEVYRARDTKLGRDVAIKVLPEAFARDPERLSRFQREARMLASLNHPNIAAIYGLEESAGTSYLVMEMVPGATLAEKIRSEGAIPVEETLALARQMAEALEAAHETGIIHRDLKPANVKVTPDGKVKILDFGLAKAFADEGTSEDIANSPTLSMAATMEGVILGTAAYMSPEQARGKSVDKRTDIWAFGVVLYEMLTGEPLFAGETVSDTLAAVLRHEPEWSKVPAPMRRLLRSCLEKDPKNRLRDIADFGLLAQDGPEPVGRPQGLGPSPPWLWAVAAAACLVAAALAVLYFREKATPPPKSVRFQIRLPEKVAFTTSADLALSPDGHRVAFPAIGPDGRTAVWVQDLDADEARALPDTDAIGDPPPLFWSPDSRFVVFAAAGKMRKADLLNATSQDICYRRPNTPIGGAWNDEGVIIFGSATSGLWKVPAAGGTPIPLTVLDESRQEREHELPSFLPDGRHFLYLQISAASEESGIYVGSLDDAPESQSKKRILATGFGASYALSEDGKTARLLFLRGSTLMAQNFDTTKLELLGEALPLTDGVGSAFETGQFSVSPNTLVYREKTASSGYQLTWFDRQGKNIGQVGDPGYITTVRISPDGTRVAFAKGTANASNIDLWVLDLARNATTRFTFGPGRNEFPVWSPDGSEIVFSSNRDGVYNLYRKPADGSKAEQLLLRTNDDKRAFSWSHDGRFLSYATSRASGTERPWALPMQGEPTPIPLENGSFDESRFEFSPDGRWVAYESNETGQYEVYVKEFGGLADTVATSGKWMISKDGGFNPRWRADGKELVYTSLDLATLMSVSVDLGRSFQAGTPRALFELPVDRGGTGRVAPTADLKRFLMTIPVVRKAAQTFTVMLNWTSVPKK